MWALRHNWNFKTHLAKVFILPRCYAVLCDKWVCPTRWRASLPVRQKDPTKALALYQILWRHIIEYGVLQDSLCLHHCIYFIILWFCVTQINVQPLDANSEMLGQTSSLDSLILLEIRCYQHLKCNIKDSTQNELHVEYTLK